MHIDYIFTGGLNLNGFASKSGISEQPENGEEREVQTKTLYGMAEGFIRVLKRMDAETLEM